MGINMASGVNRTITHTCDSCIFTVHLPSGFFPHLSPLFIIKALESVVYQIVYFLPKQLYVHVFTAVIQGHWAPTHHDHRNLAETHLEYPAVTQSQGDPVYR